MCRHEELHLWRMSSKPKSYGSLPAWMEVSINFINQDNAWQNDVCPVI
jgi:hypothetical protein